MAGKRSRTRNKPLGSRGICCRLGLDVHRTRVTAAPMGRGAVFGPHDTTRDIDAGFGPALRSRTTTDCDDVGAAEVVAAASGTFCKQDVDRKAVEDFD